MCSIHEPFYGYNGEEHDPLTGLQYLRARYYAPQNGGFLTQDSFAGILTNALSQNRYTYAENDPVNGIDPSGHAKVPGGATKGGGSKMNTAGKLVQSSKTSASTAAGAKQSPAKSPYTAPPSVPKPAPNYQKPAYTGGAAKAAQSAKTAGGQSSPAADFLMQTVADPYLAMSSTTGLMPDVIQDFTESAKSFARRMCSANMRHVEAQNEQMVQQAQSNLAAVQKAWAIGQDIWNFIAETNYQAYQTNQQQTQQDILIQLMLLEDLWNEAAQAAYINQVQYERDKINSLKSTVALLRPWTEEFLNDREDVTETGQIGINITGALVSGGSAEIGVAFDAKGNIGLYYSGGWVTMTGAALSGTIVTTGTNAETIFELAGTGLSGGVGIGDIIVGGIGIVMSKDQQTGKEITGYSANTGFGVGSPAEVHAVISYTDFLWTFNILDYYDNVESLVVN